MARKAKGKPLKLWPVRVDEDVKAEGLRLGKEHGTINEGLRSVLFPVTVEDVARQPDSTFTPAIEETIKRKVTPRPNCIREKGDPTR